MPFTLNLKLPRDGEHVATLREVVGVALGRHHAPADAVDDVQLVIAEAAGNVIRHARDTEEYSVEVVIEDATCVVIIADHGPGFAAAPHDPAHPPPLAEGGRGLALMSALTDDLRFLQDGETRVRFSKSW